MGSVSSFETPCGQPDYRRLGPYLPVMGRSDPLKIALAQVNPTVGSVDENAALVATGIAQAIERNADLVVFPELVLSGYPPDDLVFREDFLDAVRAALEKLASEVCDIVALVGFPESAQGILDGPLDPLSSPLRPIASNSVAVLRDGRVTHIYRKQLLPNYGVFDERRHFEPGTSSLVTDVAGRSVGITICEDIWVQGGPALMAKEEGAELIVNCSASPLSLIHI